MLKSGTLFLSADYFIAQNNLESLFRNYLLEDFYDWRTVSYFVSGSERNETIHRRIMNKTELLRSREKIDTLNRDFYPH